MAQSPEQEDPFKFAYTPAPKSMISRLFLALARQDYDQVRQLTGHTEQDTFELLVKVGLDAGDSEFRAKHQIDCDEAVLVWKVCTEQLMINSELEKANILYGKVQFD